jgi:N-acetylglucosaminyl-diphospho-decaprenol L-rhamnosyltransferase
LGRDLTWRFALANGINIPMMSVMPRLSVITVNWNTSKLLRECLDSLLAGEMLLPTELLVVDNGSKDDSIEMLHRHFPDVQRIENSTNLGFARANNQALARARGSYILLLNSDTVVQPEALARLVSFMELHPDAGACGPRLLQASGRAQAFAFGSDPTPGYLMRRALGRLISRRALHDWNTTQTQAVDWVAGTCLIVRRAAVAQVGPLDDKFYMYFEDVDWCRRMRQQGWNIYYHPEVSIMHLGGRSLIQNPQAGKLYYDSLTYFYSKHYGKMANLWLAVLLPLYRLATTRRLTHTDRS